MFRRPDATRNAVNPLPSRETWPILRLSSDRPKIQSAYSDLWVYCWSCRKLRAAHPANEKRVSWSSLAATNHKTIGLRYLWLALVSVFVGMITSLVMRIQLLWPGPHFVASPDVYASLTLVHGSLMVFVVLTCAPQAGFGTYFLPAQIGASEMAFPNLRASDSGSPRRP